MHVLCMRYLKRMLFVDRYAFQLEQGQSMHEYDDPRVVFTMNEDDVLDYTSAAQVRVPHSPHYPFVHPHLHRDR